MNNDGVYHQWEIIVPDCSITSSLITAGDVINGKIAKLFIKLYFFVNTVYYVTVNRLQVMPCLSV